MARRTRRRRDSDPAEDAHTSRGIARRAASRIVPENNLRPRRRLLQAGVTGLAVALAVAIILVTVPNAASQLKAPLRLLTPEPTATLPLGSDIILLAHVVPWGTLQVDGRHGCSFRPRRLQWVSFLPIATRTAHARLCGCALSSNPLHSERACQSERYVQGAQPSGACQPSCWRGAAGAGYERDLVYHG